MTFTQSRRQPIPARHAPGLLVATFALVFGSPSFAEDGLDGLRKELVQQRQMLEHQKQMIDRLEQQLSRQTSVRPAPAAIAAAAPGQAETKPLVTIYGVLDSGVEHITNIGSNHRSLTRVPPITATLPSRLGFRLNKTFKPGYAAIGTLEAGFNMDDGTQGQSGRIFGRQLHAGLSTPAGSFTFGRQYSMLLPALATSDLLGPNIYALGSFDAYLPNARYDNSLAWHGKFSNLSLGLAYSFGRDTSGGAPASGTCAGEQTNINDTQECKAISAMIRYDAAHFGVAAAVDQIKGGTGASAFFFNGAAPFAFSSSSDKDRRVNLGGYLKFGPAKLGLGWLGRKVSTDAQDVSSDTYYLTGSYKLNGPVTLDGGVHRVVNSDQNRNATLVTLRGFYNLDQGLDAYVQYGHIENSKNATYQLSGAGGGTAPAAGGSQNGYMVGIRYIF